MKSESGVHDLCVFLPLIAELTAYCFASVWVYPAIEDDVNIKIDEKDLRIDTYRSSGAADNT